MRRHLSKLLMILTALLITFSSVSYAGVDNESLEKFLEETLQR